MTTKRFFINLLLIFCFIALMIILVLFWLKVYTNHGQSLELPDYSGVALEEAIEDAKDRSFEIIVNDSVHMVDQPGGLIIDQNPKPLARVKEYRKIYVTTTKFDADVIKLSDLRTLYGNNYEAKSKELAYQKINTEIKSRKFDAGAPGHILEVWYDGILIDSKSGRKEDIEIEKGSTLEFVISKNSGAQLKAPDLICTTLAGARFALDIDRLEIGEIEESGVITDPESATIIDQSPRPNASVEEGQIFNLVIVQEAPEDCN